MCEFVNGQVIEYQSCDTWVKGTYIGKYPTTEGFHVICNMHGTLLYGKEIRKPKVKKEGWMNVWSVRNPNYHGAIANATRIYATKEEALKANHPNRQVQVLDTVKVEWYEHLSM